MSWKPNQQGPWGRPPGKGKPSEEDSTSDMEALLRRGQSNMSHFLNGNGVSPRFLAALIFIALCLWILSGLYTVQPNEVGLNLVFGRYVGRTEPGLNFNWPSPIGDVIKPKVTEQNYTDVGMVVTKGAASRFSNSLSQTVEVPKESLMLTGDQNIADVKFRIIWQIDPSKPQDFVFNIRAPEETIKAVGEGAMRELVGQTPIQRLLTTARSQIEPAVHQLTQTILDRYQAGVKILQIQLLPVDPPEQVIAAFKDVTIAQQDKDRLQNEAETYANQVIPTARGNAERILQEAEAYRAQIVAQAKGQTSRFTQIQEEYKAAPEVTKKRLSIETMERVLGNADKLVLDPASRSMLLPYLFPTAKEGFLANGERK